MRVLLIILSLSLLPDLDVIPGLLAGDLHGIHNSVTNSLIIGVLAAFALGGLMWFVGRMAIREWVIVALLSYWLHVAMDYFTAERGVMLIWPLTSERYVAPIRLFYGVHYSEGLISIRHVWTVVTELAFALILLLAFAQLAKMISKRGSASVQ